MNGNMQATWMWINFTKQGTSIYLGTTYLQDKEKDNLEISEKPKDQQIEESNAKNTNEPTDASNSKKITNLDTTTLLSKQSLSSPIELKGQKEVPSLLDKSYSENEWMTWVLLGEGMMPSYSEILHSTDAIKIKTYLDGL